jgi:hypothetical protein
MDSRFVATPPALPAEPWFVDADGTSFQYGTGHFRRGGPTGDEPLVEAYSRDSHPERFAPFVAAVGALMAQVTSAFDVTVTHDVPLDATIVPRIAGARATRYTPFDAAASPLTIVTTTYPGIVILAGALVLEPVPVCGCDACDETAASGYAAAERLILAVINGGLTEWTGRAPKRVRELTGRRGLPWLKVPSFAPLTNAPRGAGRAGLRGASRGSGFSLETPDGQQTSWSAMHRGDADPGVRLFGGEKQRHWAQWPRR